jgi:hypothetical protein
MVALICMESQQTPRQFVLNFDSESSFRNYFDRNPTALWGTLFTLDGSHVLTIKN